VLSEWKSRARHHFKLEMVAQSSETIPSVLVLLAAQLGFTKDFDFIISWY
jgi:hypothetical protein